MFAAFYGYSIAIGLVSIMIAASGIMLGLGIAADDRKLKELGKSELSQAVISGVIVGTLLLLFSQNGLVTGLTNSITTSVVSSPCGGALSDNYAICFADRFLVGVAPVSINGKLYPTLMDSTAAILLPSIALYGALSFIASLKFSVVIVSVSLAGILQPALSVLNRIIGTMTLAVVSLDVQAMLLQFVALTSLSVLLPTGIILRTFYFTRRLGGAIIAITIALFAVLPMTYVMNAELIARYSSEASVGINGILANVTAERAGISGAISATNVSGSLLGSVSSSVASLSVSVQAALTGMMNAVALIVVEAFFLPTFSIMLTIVSAKELARVLGSELSFSRFNIF